MQLRLENKLEIANKFLQPWNFGLIFFLSNFTGIVQNNRTMIQMYIAFGVLAICLYFKYKCSFWARRKIDGPAPLPLFGNLIDFVMKKRHFGEIHREIYEWVSLTPHFFVIFTCLIFSSYPTARYVGFYKIDSAALLIRDLVKFWNIFWRSFVFLSFLSLISCRILSRIFWCLNSTRSTKMILRLIRK